MAQNQNDCIVRQSSLKWLLDYIKIMDVKLTLKEIMKITDVLTDYCNKGYSPDMELVVDAIDKHIKSKIKTLQNL